MFTQTLGVTETYENENFYTSGQASFQEEQTRISQLFKNHKALGIRVEIKELSHEYIRDEISKGCVCILLVDAAKLNGIDIEDADGTMILNTEDEITSCCFFNSSSNLSFKL